jgi:hypothetical protein
MVFDLDGVLVETRRANELAYRYAGVVPPGNHHVVPWQTWTTKEVHDAKNAALSKFIGEIRALPLMDLITSQTIVLSNCSDPAMKLLASLYEPLQHCSIHNNLDASGKTRFLWGARPIGVYFDDSAEVCALVKTHTEWQTCRVL